MSPRIITLTLNPALDLAAEADEVVPTHKIRMHHEHADPGGGGVNVARVLQELGGDVIAIVAAGGATGRVFEEMLDEARVRRRSVLVSGQTRVSLNVQDLKRGLEYRFVPQGPTLSFAEFEACLAAVEMEPGEWLIASGSLPHGVPDDAYAQVARIAARKGQRFVVDTSGAALAAALAQGGCELVKPSLGELEHLVGRELKDPREQNREAMALVRQGAARMVAVTLGADGACWRPRTVCCGCRRWTRRCTARSARATHFWPPRPSPWRAGGTPANALDWGTAAGAAAIACAGTARLRRADVEARYRALCSHP